MKYIWLFVLVGLMAWTWSMASNDQPSDLRANSQLQTALAERIIETLKQQRPAAKNINFLQLYTEVIEEGKKQIAHFRYAIDEPTVSGDITSQIIEGTATLVSVDEGASWQIVKANATSPSLSFQNGSRITPQMDDGTSAAPSTKPDEQ